MKLPGSIVKILNSAIPTLRRFWVSVGFTIASTTVMIMMSSTGPQITSQETLNRLLLAGLLGVVTSWCAILIWEGKQIASELRGNLIALPTSLLISFGVYFMLRETSFIPLSRYTAIMIFFSLIFFVIPYTYRKDALEMYVTNLFTQAVISVLFSFVFFVGVSGITFTISALFSIDMAYNVYLHIWMVMAGIVAPFLFMAGIPLRSHLLDAEDYPKTLKNLILFVVTPLLSIYTIILYVYFGKILITRQWPIGLISHLVLWYSLVSTAVLFFTGPLTTKNRWAEAFNRYFIKVVIPLLFMMFTSMGIRIDAYGVTENRYYVLILGIWVLGSMIFLNISKSRRSVILPASLAVVVILSVIGPWSSFSVSKWSQNQRLHDMLSKHNMIENGYVLPSHTSIPTSDQREIVEIVFYFNRYHTLSDIRLLPADFTMRNFEDVFGFDYAETHFFIPREFFRYDVFNQSLDISKYDYLFNFVKTSYSREPAVTIIQDNVEVSYDRDTQYVYVSLNRVTEWEKPLNTYARILHDKYGIGTISDLSTKDTSFTEESTHLIIEFVIMGVSGETDPDSQETHLHQVEFIVLVGVK